MAVGYPKTKEPLKKVIFIIESISFFVPAFENFRNSN